MGFDAVPGKPSTNSQVPRVCSGRGTTNIHAREASERGNHVHRAAITSEKMAPVLGELGVEKTRQHVLRTTLRDGMLRPTVQQMYSGADPGGYRVERDSL